MGNGDISDFYSGIEAVCFDVTGTLFEVKGGVGEIYSRLAGRYGVDSEPEQIEAAFSRYFRLQPPLAFPLVTPDSELRKLEHEWWRKLVSEVFDGYHFSHFDRFFAEIFDYFGNQDAWQVYGDVVPALEALSMRGLRMAVVSNFDTRLYGLLRGLALDVYFDDVCLSSRIGAAKPDPRIFGAALARMDVGPRQSLHIGDSIKEDVEGATNAGMKAVLLDRSGGRAHADHVVCINNLVQLIELLG